MANKKQRHYQSGNPARRAAGAPSPNRDGGSSAAAPSGFRAVFNRTSAPLLVTLHSLPRWVLPVVMGLLLAGGLFLSGSWGWLGAVLLGLVALIVLWLFTLSWPVLTPGGRVGRGLVLLGLAGMTALKALGRL